MRSGHDLRLEFWCPSPTPLLIGVATPQSDKRFLYGRNKLVPEANVPRLGK